MFSIILNIENKPQKTKKLVFFFVNLFPKKSSCTLFSKMSSCDTKLLRKKFYQEIFCRNSKLLRKKFHQELFTILFSKKYFQRVLLRSIFGKAFVKRFFCGKSSSIKDAFGTFYFSQAFLRYFFLKSIPDKPTSFQEINSLGYTIFYFSI